MIVLVVMMMMMMITMKLIMVEDRCNYNDG